jgi:hypothetical protein
MAISVIMPMLQVVRRGTGPPAARKRNLSTLLCETYTVRGDAI